MNKLPSKFASAYIGVTTVDGKEKPVYNAGLIHCILLQSEKKTVGEIDKMLDDLKEVSGDDVLFLNKKEIDHDD